MNENIIICQLPFYYQRQNIAVPLIAFDEKTRNAILKRMARAQRKRLFRKRNNARRKRLACRKRTHKRLSNKYYC